MDVTVQSYAVARGFDEYFSGLGNGVHRHALHLLNRASEAGFDRLAQQLLQAQQQLLRDGVEYRLDAPTPTHPERFLPFDPLPRLILSSEWDRLVGGLQQRSRALDALVDDLYGAQRIVRDGVIPEALITSSPFWRPELRGCGGQGRRWCAVAAFDLIRTAHDGWLVLEENLRRGTGIGYALAARETSIAHFPWLMDGYGIAPIHAGLECMREALVSLAPWRENPDLVVLTPGRQTSAFYEHNRLAAGMGIPVHEPQELWVEAGRVWRQAPAGVVPVDVIYRRNEDFYPSSVRDVDLLLGIPGLMEVWREGSVAIANPPGTGIASDKLLYSFIPEVIRYYLSEDPRLAQVPTYRCFDALERAHVLSQLEHLVVKQVGGAGGVGMLMGPESTLEQRQHFAALIEQSPRHFVAQPVQELSTLPCWREGRLRRCSVDLRPFVVFGDQPSCLPGALTRVALVPESKVVNLSQGGGYKDTWLLPA